MSNNPFWDQQQQFFKVWNDNMNKIPGMHEYQEMYKKMMPDTDQWAKMAESVTNPVEFWGKMAEFTPNPVEYMEKIQAAMPNPMEFWGKMAASAPDMTELWKNFSQMAPNADFMKQMSEMMTAANPWAKAFGYQIPGTELYGELFSFWKDLANPQTFVQNYPEKFNNLMWDVFKSVMPQGVQYFEKPHELLQTCIDFYNNVFGPWMKIDEDLMKRISTGDMRAYVEFFRTFDDRYEETFNKLFNMMGMGLNRESNAEQMQMINSSIKMLYAAGEMVALVMESCMNATKTMMEHYQAGLQEGKTITTFQEFYDLWYKVTEEALLALFNTDEFSKAFCDFADKTSQYMIASNKVCERQFAQLPIPTNKDMTSLYKTVYDLRKEVRDLRRELETMKNAASAK